MDCICYLNELVSDIKKGINDEIHFQQNIQLNENNEFLIEEKDLRQNVYVMVVSRNIKTNELANFNPLIIKGKKGVNVIYVIIYVIVIILLYLFIRRLSSKSRFDLSKKNDDAESFSSIGMIYSEMAHELYKNTTLSVTNPGYKEFKTKLRGLYSKAKDAYESSKKYAPNVKTLWYDGLRNAYFRLNMGKELKELEKINKVIESHIEGAPHETLLVIDASTGQNGIMQAESFKEITNITGIVLTKLDGDTKGGCALSIVQSTKKPIKLVAQGENIKPLEDFHPDRISNRILGMGDIVSLVEKAQETVDIEDAKKLEAKMARNEFTLDDMLEQFQRVKKMGNMHSLMEMIPGLAGQIDESKVDFEGMKHQEAIILSMTKKERANHLIIGPSRRKRIAKGSGTSVAEVNKLIKQFEKTKLTMKKLTRNKGMQAKLMQQMGDMGAMEKLAGKFGGMGGFSR